MNVLTVPPEMRDELERRFAGRAGMVESQDGFEWFELLRPVDGTDRYLVYTRWRSEEDFRRWHESMAFQRGHERARTDRAERDAEDGAGEGGHPSPAASDSEVWSFEVVQHAAPRRS